MHLLGETLRTYDSVRASIDAKLGDGQGVSAGDAVRRLSNVEHVVWALDNFFASVFAFRLHIWDQGFRGAGYDGPAFLTGIAEVARESDPRIAALLQWSAHWVTTRPVPLVSVVPELWALHEERAFRFLRDVAARWPEDQPPPHRRPHFHHASERPLPAVGFTARGAGCSVQCAPEQQDRDGVFRCVLQALWDAGAADQTLDDFFAAYFERGAVEADVVSQFVSFDGDGGDDERRAVLQRRIRPPSALAALLGLAEPPAAGLIHLDRREQLGDALAGWNVADLAGGDVRSGLLAALRRDVDAVIVDGEALTGEAVEPLLNAVFSGVLVFVIGVAPLLTTAPIGANRFDLRRNRG